MGFKPKKRHLFVAIIAIVAIVVLTVGIRIGPSASFIISKAMRDEWFPFDDDGPYRGYSRTSALQEPPSQTLSLPNGDKIAVYPSRGDYAPTLVLFDRNEKLLWSIYAIPGSSKADAEKTSGSVKAITLHDFETRTRKEPTINVTGIVDWTYGKEAMNLYINSNGELHGYFFSW